MILNKFHLRYPLDDKETLFINTLTGALDYFSNDVIEYIDRLTTYGPAATQTKEEEALVHLLKQRGYMYDSVQEENKRIQQALTFSTPLQQMEYVICPTYTCNFRCPYCFEDHSIHEKISLMTDEQLDAVMLAIDYFHKESGLQKGFLQLFGGEPLLPFTRDIVKKICDKAVTMDFRITCNTNGFHLESYVDLMFHYRDRINITVTVDGPEEIHDKRRILTGGQGTFSRIEKGVLAALKKGIGIVLRVNIDKTNINYVGDLVNHYRKNGFIEHEAFLLHFAPITDHTCKGTGDTIMEGFEIIKRLRKDIPDLEELEKNNRLRIGPDMYRFLHTVMRLDPELRSRASEFVPHIVFCESVQGRKVVFGPDSHMYACADLIGRPEYKIGNYFPNFELTHWKWSKWKAFNSLTIQQCSSCHCAPICGGGCAAEALITYGNLDKPHCTHADQQVYNYLDSIRDELLCSVGD
ncbi:radical SAM/SPASM domain-containing protein [Paenibacillus sp. YYML68]|uniref:radical SAM/SPASM domain-containing protein n=1 Tax=Paenibacillus sp. YYML68 TaxID=2909250 RepID=UPI0024923A39|nr:radical SAM protein [Paenibacillus sp. YYML68]